MSFLSWLLDLDDIRFERDAPISLEWVGGMPTWLLVCALVALLLVTGLVYRRERTSVPRRVLLGVNRMILFALILTALCQPALVLHRLRVEPSYVSLAVDTSASMGARESYDDGDYAAATAEGAGLADAAEVGRYTRLELIKKALLRDSGAPLAALAGKNELQLVSFAGVAEPLAYAADPASMAGVLAQLDRLSPDGKQTDLAGAIAHAFANTRGRRLSALVLATDGQSTEPSSIGDAIDMARGKQVPIHVIRIGLPHRMIDIEMGPLRAEEVVFVNDLLAVEALVTGHGITEPTRVSVQMSDEASGKTVASREVELTPDAPSARIELSMLVPHVGEKRLRVEAAALPGESITTNNSETIDVRVLDDRVSVLYVEGYPRYEYRYLKNALVRERTVDISVLLVEADRDFVQEGTNPIRRFPVSPEELNQYDLLLFGDVDPRGGWLTGAQMNMILDFVGNRGGGFGLIAGDRHTPHRFLGTPLEKLIPVSIDPAFSGGYDQALTTGYKPVLTYEGKRSRVFRLGLGGGGADSAADTWDELPEVFWMARTLGAKPGATVLSHHPTWQALPVGKAGVEPMPVVVMGRYGAGKIFFQATDDTWRWRRHTGEMLHDAYWVQVVRELLRSDRFSQGRRLVLRTDRKRYAYGAPVRVEMEILDSSLLADVSQVVHVRVGATNGSAASGEAAPGDAAELDPLGTISLYPVGGRTQTYEGSYLPPGAGGYRLDVEEFGSPADWQPAATTLRVDKPDREGRRPEADHATLARIADGTGGRVITLNELEAVFGSIPDRSIQIPDDIVEPLWDSRLFLILFFAVLTMEWVLRKAFGLI